MFRRYQKKNNKNFIPLDQKIPPYPHHPSADPVRRSPWGSAVSLSGRCSGSSWTCQIGAHGDPDNWNRTVQQRKRFL